MRDEPIIFSTPMVRALLEGRKTQTRRALKIKGHKTFSEFGSSDTKGYDWHFRDSQLRWHDYRHADLLRRLPYAAGDRLWVREAHAWPKVWDDDPERVYIAHVWYPAGEQGRGRIVETPKPADFGKTRSPIHMPRWASRLTLVVTDVRVQRLHEISEADAWAEGCKPGDPWDNGKGHFPADEPDPSGKCWFGWDNARDWYADLWDRLHGDGAWEVNPWVAAISFETRHIGIVEMSHEPEFEEEADD